MALNMISNFGANVAHRNLVATDAQATASLAKLSSGTRVVSSKDDAASLAIGSRLHAEVQALRQATVNAGQAASMLQIADGAMARVSDILTRMKTLSVQASSGQLGNTERSMLDTEFGALLSEIDRISADTEFNGNSLLNGSTRTITNLNGLGAAANLIEAADGFHSISFGNSVGDARTIVAYDAANAMLTLTDLGTGQSQSVDIGASAIALNETQVVDFDHLDIVVTLNSAFDKTADIAPTGSFTAAGAGQGSVQASTIELIAATAGMQAAIDPTVTISGASADNATLTLAGGFSASGVDLSSTGTHTVTLSDGTDSITVAFTVGTAFNDAATAAGDGAFTVDGLGSLAYGTVNMASSTSFSFKLGTGTVADVDSVTYTIEAVHTTALGITGATLATQASAESAITAITASIDTLNMARANLGAAQNRLEFSAANLSLTIENSEAARSSLLDLDVAAEMTNFTSKQILMQAGVSMLAQANQMPQNLLQLLQQ